MSIPNFAQNPLITCILGPSHYDEIHNNRPQQATDTPAPTATYLATWKGDTERNVYATQMPQVMDDAAYEANKQTAELFCKNKGIERPEWLNTKKPELFHSHEHVENNPPTEAEQKEFQTNIKQFYETFKAEFGKFATDNKLPIVQADHQGFDYDVVYLQGMEQFVQNAQKAGLKFPKEVSTLSYKQNEQLKAVRSGMNGLNDADQHTGPNRAEINSRMATEKQLAIYSNMYHHAAHVLKTQSSELAALLAYDPNSRSLVPSPTFKKALGEGKSALKAFLKEHAPSLNIKALSTFTPPEELDDTNSDSDSNTEATFTKLVDQIFKPQADCSIASASDSTKDALTTLLNQIFAKTPLLQDTVKLAKLSVLEEATQAKSLNTLENRISINSGSSYLEKTSNGFRLNQPYGQHNGQPCAYELIAENQAEKTTYTLNRIDAQGNKTALQNINQLSGDQISLETLKSYFFQADINDLFGEKQSQLPESSSFAKLAARIKTQEVVNQKIESRLNQELKQITQEALAKKNIVSIQGTGFSYNAGLYGENQAVDSRTVMSSVLFGLAQEGKVALHGSCGFQQNAIWNMGGNITALQDTTGKTFLADPNHGNDPFTVEEKKSYQTTKRFTTRFGMYENKVNGQWEKRNHEPLRVELNINEGEEIRSIPVYFKGQPVIGLAGYQQAEQLTQADQQTVTLTKAWDQEEKVDGNGQPIQSDKRSTITLRYNEGKRAYEIQSIQHWQAVPLANPENPAELLMKGNEVQFGYEEVTQTGPDIDPAVLVDNSFDPINCVHTQNGLGAPTENQNLRGNLEIVGTSVLGNDGTHGRSTILAASKQNPWAHPVSVDPRTKRETLITEALEMRLGNLSVATFNQHHTDMHMHEGHSKTNPYDKDHTAYIDEKDKGNRHGNASVTQTGMLLKNIQALNKKIGGLKAEEGTQTNKTVDETPLLKPSELKGTPSSTIEIKDTVQVWMGGTLTEKKDTQAPQAARIAKGGDIKKALEPVNNTFNGFQKLNSMNADLKKAFLEHVQTADDGATFSYTQKDSTSIKIEWHTLGTKTAINTNKDPQAEPTKRIQINGLSYEFKEYEKTYKLQVDYTKKTVTTFVGSTEKTIEDPQLVEILAGNLIDQLLTGQQPLPHSTTPTQEITEASPVVSKAQKKVLDAVKAKNNAFKTLIKNAATREAAHVLENLKQKEQALDKQSTKTTAVRKKSLKDLLDDETKLSSTDTSSSAHTSESNASTSSSSEAITLDEMSDFPLQGKTTQEIVNNLKTEAAKTNKTIAPATLKNIELILSSDAWKNYTTAHTQADQAHTQLIALADKMTSIQDKLSKHTSPEMTELQKNSDQRRFRGTGRGKDGWAQGAGLTAGVGGTGFTHSLYSAIEQAGHVAETVGQIATLVDSVMPFGVLLALAGAEGFKNAAYSTRRLNQVAKAYEAEHAACLKTINETKKELNTIYTKSLQKEVIESTILEDLKKTEQTLQNRINKIGQDLEQNLVSMVASPLLPVASVATAVGSSAKLAGATAASSIAGIVGGAALTAYGAIQTGNAIRVLNRSNKVTRAISNENYIVDSGVRRNFNIYHQQRRNALKFKVANWGAFTAGSAMLVAGSAATLTGVGAAVGLPLSITGGLMVAGSVVTGVIDPKREWRGKTGMNAEDTVHLQGDFLSTGRRRNRLIHALNNQIGMWGKTMGNIVDHALTSDKPGMKNFSRRFNTEKTLRWFSPNYHMRALGKAMTEHPEEVKDHQFNLMLRTTLQEINFVNFKVDELQARVNQLTQGLAVAPNHQEIKIWLKQAHADLTRAKQQQANLHGLLSDLHAYEPEIGRKFREIEGDNTREQFDHLRVKYMLAHDLLADGLHRRDIRKLVNLPGNNGHVTAVIDNNTYSKGGQAKDPSGKLRTVAFKYGKETEAFVLKALEQKELGSKLDINRLFARVMSESLPARINYELAAVYNVHMEDLYQQSKSDQAKSKTSAPKPVSQWTSDTNTDSSLEAVKKNKGFMKNPLKKLGASIQKEWKNMRHNGWLDLSRIAKYTPPTSVLNVTTPTA